MLTHLETLITTCTIFSHSILGQKSKESMWNMTPWKSKADNTLHNLLKLLQESIEFRQTALETTLQLVYSIIWELKTHEIIENTVIMQVTLDMNRAMIKFQSCEKFLVKNYRRNSVGKAPKKREKRKYKHKCCQSYEKGCIVDKYKYKYECCRSCERGCTVDKCTTSQSVIAMRIQNWWGWSLWL